MADTTTQPATIPIHLNGEPRTLPANSTVKEMMNRFGFTGTGSAVAINMTFVPTDRYDNTVIEAGDRIEVLGAIYGG